MTTRVEVKPEDLTFLYETGMAPFPFVEDENANITGYGHQDPRAFALEIDRYDFAAGVDLDPERPAYWRDYVVHRWGVAYGDSNGEWRIKPCAETDEGAFPITCVWGQR